MVIVLEKINGALAGSIGLVAETIAAYKKQEDHGTVRANQDAASIRM
jgi:hypothetical protein